MYLALPLFSNGHGGKARLPAVPCWPLKEVVVGVALDAKGEKKGVPSPAHPSLERLHCKKRIVSVRTLWRWQQMVCMPSSLSLTYSTVTYGRKIPPLSPIISYGGKFPFTIFAIGTNFWFLTSTYTRGGPNALILTMNWMC